MYERQVWENGDVITAEKLNMLENRAENIIIITDGSTDLDIDYLVQALRDGKNVIAKYVENDAMGDANYSIQTNYFPLDGSFRFTFIIPDADSNLLIIRMHDLNNNGEWNSADQFTFILNQASA